MRVLVTALLPSHLMHIVPLSWALRTAGHDPLIAGPPPVADAAEAAGLTTFTVPRSPVGPGQALPGHAPQDQAQPAPTALVRVPSWDDLAPRWQARVGAMVGRYLEFARAWQPDLIITDPLEFSGLIVGGVLGVPVVAHRWGPEFLTGHAHATAARALRPICERAGLDGGLPQPALVADPCPPSLQFPESMPGLAFRYVPYNGAGSMPDWALSPPARRRICVSLGLRALTESGWMPAAMSVIDAIAETDGVEAVITAGQRFRRKIGDVPGNVSVFDPVPIGLVLPSCHAVVHHGGSGTTLTSLSFGLPQLALPQPDPALVVCAERIGARGVGVTLDDPSSQRDPAVIREALLAVLDDPRYAASAREVQREMTALPTVTDLVPALEHLATQRLAA